MEDTGHKRGEYSTPRWVQVWFLKRSRDSWKRKALARKGELKRWKNCAADVSKSRDRWRAEAERLRQQAKELEKDKVPLSHQSAAKKKDGPGALAGSRR